MDTVNKDSAVSEDANVAETSILEISSNNQDDTLSYQSADENNSKYFSIISDSTLEGTSSADVTLEDKSTIEDNLTKKQLISNLLSIQSKSVDKLQIHEKIDAAKILSGGVDIFDDNENSSDEHGLVIDDAQMSETTESNVTIEDDSKKESEKETKNVDSVVTAESDETKACKKIKLDSPTKGLLKNDNKSETPEQVDQMRNDPLTLSSGQEVVEQDAEKTDNYSDLLQSNLPEGSSEVTLLIDDKNVDAIDIGEGVFIYKNDEGELTAIQITMNEDGTTNFKCLHVGKNEDGNLEVYEEQVNQVPVTTEELESMRSQELAKESNLSLDSAGAASKALPDNKDTKVASSEQKIVISNKDETEKQSKDLTAITKKIDEVLVVTDVVDKEQNKNLMTSTVDNEEKQNEDSPMISDKDEQNKDLLNNSSQSKDDKVVESNCDDKNSLHTEKITVEDSSKDATATSNVSDSLETMGTTISTSDSAATSELLNEDDKPIEEPVKMDLKLASDEDDTASHVDPIEEMDSLSVKSNVLPIVEKVDLSAKETDLSSEVKKIEDVGIANFIVSKLKTSSVGDFMHSTNLLDLKSSEKSLIGLSAIIKESKTVQQDDSAANVASPVNVCGVATKISDPVLPSEVISDSQDSTSNILSVMNNEESSNTIESVVSSCPSINPTDSIMSEQLSINDSLKLSENKELSFEMSNLEFKGESTQSASLSEDVSQGESIPKSISDDDISDDSNLQPLVIEDISVSQDALSETTEDQKDDTKPIKTVNETCKTVEQKEVQSMDESAESQTSIESDDEDYVVGEPVTGDSGLEWNVDKKSNEKHEEPVQTNSVVENVTVKDDNVIETTEKVVDASIAKTVEISDNNNDISKSILAQKENENKTKEAEMVIQEVDFDKFVRRNSVQVFEECEQVDYEDVSETIKNKSVPVLELETKSNTMESNNVHITVCRGSESVSKVQDTSSIMNKTSKSLDESVTYLSHVAEKTPSPNRNVNTFKPTYSPVETNKYMNKSPYSGFTNQVSKPYLPNAVSPTPQSPSQGIRRLEPNNSKPKTYSPLHKAVPQNLSPVAQKSEKILSFSLINEKQSTSLPTTPQQASMETISTVPENLSQNSKLCSTGTQVEDAKEDISNKSKSEIDSAEAQRLKNRQPRKQVFTPVTSSDMEIIFPNLYNNAQEYKKETDAKAIKLKKEQDLKFKQLSKKKEQSRRNEKINKIPAKPMTKVVSPVRTPDKVITKESTLLSTPVKSFEQVKNPIEPVPVKINDKPIPKEPPHLVKPNISPERNVNQYPIQLHQSPVKSYNDTITSKNIPHLTSPVKSFEKGNDSPKKSSPIHILDKVRDQQMCTSSEYTVKEPFMVSPVKNASHQVPQTKNVERKSYGIDLPALNADKRTIYGNQLPNHHGVDNSRLKESSSPRTYSRFMNKPPVQNVYNQSMESPRPMPIQPLPKVIDVLDKKNVLFVEGAVKKQTPPIIYKEKSDSKKFTESNSSHKDNVKESVRHESVRTNLQQQDHRINVSKENTQKNLIPVETKKSEINVNKLDKDVKLVDNKRNIEESLIGVRIDKTSTPKTSADPNPSKVVNSSSKSPSTTENNLNSSVKTKQENDSPLTDSVKRKRGRPKKVVTDSPVVAPSLKPESPIVKPASPIVKPASPIVKPVTTPKRKPTPKDLKVTPKSEEKSRASSISPFGKIDENIKCPICFKTFRTHNVLIKHVKHCNGTIEVEAVKSPKRRKLTDSIKSEESMESEKSETEKETENDSKTAIEKVVQDSTNKTDNTPVKKLKVDKADVEEVNDFRGKINAINKSVEISKDATIETIVLEDSIVSESSSPNLDKTVKASGKNKVGESSESTKNENVRKRLPGRPPKDKNIEEIKQASKQTAVASPMSRLSKILNTKPPVNSTIACNVCGKTFRQLAHMAYHRSSKHGTEETDSPVDTVSTVNSNNTNKPKPEVVVETPVESDSILKCEICNKGFRKLHHLVEHREVHANNETKSRRTSVASVKSEPEAGFRCDTCDKSFRKLHHLVEHRELHLAEVADQTEVPTTPSKASEPKPIEDATCPGCGKSFRKRHHMVEHRDIHCSPSKKGKLEDGSSSSTTDGNIRLSIASSNSDESNNCGICGKSYRKLHHMVEHRESHSEVKEKKIEPKTSIEPELLNTKDIIHECSRCYMVFPNENSLNKHIDICSKKRLVKKSFNFNVQNNEDVVNLEQTEQIQDEQSSVASVEDRLKQSDLDTDNDVIVLEPTEEPPKPIEPSEIKPPLDVECQDDVTNASSKSSSQTIPVPRKSTDSKTSMKSQKTERKSIVPSKEKTVPTSQNVRKSTLTKETISSKSRRSLITKHQSTSSDDISVVSRSSSLRKSSISSESVSSRASLKRKSTSSMERLPTKKSTKDSSESKSIPLRKSMDSGHEKTVKTPNRRSLQKDSKDEDLIVKYKLNENVESDVKYKINPGFSKSIKRLSHSSIDSRASVKTTTTVSKAKERRSESALSGLKLPNEKVLQTIIEETNVLYSFPKSAKKTPEADNPTMSQPAAKKTAVVKQPAIVKRKVVITKKVNLVVANKRKSLGGRKSIDTKALPVVAKKLQLKCCSQVFSSQADLALHRKTHKEVHKVHKCDCGKVFDTEGLLKRHMDIEHTPPKSYKCATCGTSVRTAAQYAKHKRDHETQQRVQKSPVSKKSTQVKSVAGSKQVKDVNNKDVQKTQVPKAVKAQPGKSKSPIKETRKSVKRKIAHGGVPLSDKMRKAIGGDKF